MKKRLTFLILLLCAVFHLSADLADWHWQEVEYHYDASAPNETVTVLMNYWMDGTVVHEGQTYNKLYRKCVYQDSAKLISNNGLIYSYDTIFRCNLREDASGHIYYAGGIFNYPERMLYDFSDWSIGDTLYINFANDNTISKIITENDLDSILLQDGNYTQTFTGFNCELIRGIGFKFGFLSMVSVYSTQIGGMIVSFYKGDQLIWKNPDYVGLQNPSFGDEVRAYSHEGRLIVEVPPGICRLDVYSLNGSLRQSCFAKGINVVKTAPLPPGLYFYTVIGGNGSMIARNKIVVPYSLYMSH